MSRPTEELGEEGALGGACRYHCQIDVNSDSVHAKVVRLVGTNKRVLELGCATGYMSRVLREQGCQVVAVEINRDGAARAAEFCERVIVGDIEHVDLALELGADVFDVIVAADVLEHLRDPVSILMKVKRFLGPGGYVVASIPNVAHGSVRLALLTGKFPYGEYGLLDSTHLRFFTQESMEKLFSDAGFVVVHQSQHERAIEEAEVPYDKAAVSRTVAEEVSNDSAAQIYQFVVVAYAVPDEAAGLMWDRVRGLTAEAETARRQVVELRRAAERQVELERRIEALTDEKEAAQRDAREMRSAVEKQGAAVEMLAARVQLLCGQSRDLQASVNDLEALAATAFAPSKDIAYRQLIRRIRGVVRTTLPRDATVAVVSKGDGQLLDIECGRAWHFPQSRDGTYPGFYPAGSTSAIAQVEVLRARGAHFLLFPNTSLWWLTQYKAFGDYLRFRYRTVVREEDTCIIFDLREPQGPDASVWSELEGVVAEFRSTFDRDPAVLDWDTGLELKARYPEDLVFSPPKKDRALAYVDRSIDLVAVPEGDPVALAEAHRVAAGAVLRVPGPGAANETRGRLVVEWKRGRSPRPIATTSILVPCHNGVQYTLACLRSLWETLPGAFEGEIIVVDDGSTDETAIRIQELADRGAGLKVVRNETNEGFVSSCNRGARVATGDVLVFLNNDTIALPGWFPPLLRVFRDHPDAGAVGGRLVFPDGQLQEAGGVVFSDGSAANFGRDDYDVDAPLYRFVREVDYCSAALLATPRHLFEEVGGFDVRYAPAYYEDTDYCFEVRKRSHRVYYQPESVIVHYEGGTSGTDLSSGVKRYQLVNRAKFVTKWSHVLSSQPTPPSRFEFAAWHALAVRPRCKA